MILVVYFFCTLTMNLRLWSTKYRRNRINFASFVRSAALILKGQWGGFWRKLQPWGFLDLLTCHPVLVSLFHTLFVGDVLFHFYLLPLFLLLDVLPNRSMREGFSYLLVVSVFLTPYSFILFYYESRKRELKTRLIYEDRFRRGRQRLPGCVARTDAPVYMRERGGGRRGMRAQF